MREKITRYLRINKMYSVYGYALIVGVVTGFAAILFIFLLDRFSAFVTSLHNFNYDSDVATSSQTPEWHVLLWIIFLPAIGGLITGLITHRFSGNSSGTGTDQMIDAFHNKEGRIEGQAPFWKSVATIFTLGTGGSGGKEGPVAYIGAGIGALVARIAGAGARARRTLLLSGTAAGLGAVFKAPLGGALTAAEMVYKEDIESDALIPCFISSVTAYIVFMLFAGSGHFMDIQANYTLHLIELPFYLLLGGLCYPFGYLFMRSFNDTRKYLGLVKLHPVLKPALGGLAVGMISVFFFEISGTGNEFLLAVADGKHPVFMGRGVLIVVLAFLVIAFLKIVATSLTIGSGGSAGIFGPSLFIGAMLGAATGTFAAYLLPGTSVSIASYVVVGMGAFYAGVANAPIAGIIMICEMTGTYVLLPPLIIVSIFTFILSRKITIYKNQVENRFKSPAHLWDMKFDVIETITLRDKIGSLRDLAVMKENDPFEKMRKRASEIEASDFVIINDTNEYVGVVRLRSIDYTATPITTETKAGNFVDRTVPVVTLKENMNAVLNIIVKHDVDKVSVVDGKIFLGYIRSRDVFYTYSEAVRGGEKK